ncbi:MAG TPA: methyltransferase domain-containing protein [Candidatus Saccharimonadales bacterium]|nr:methyltransferase domain-containing protein [Candidatus Saccharimonadales bacterium]
MSKTKTKSLDYFSNADNIVIPSPLKTFLSRLMFPVLSLLSREQSLKLGLTPIDDERVIMGLKHTKGRLLDIGCGANNFVHSYGNGVGVDVADWKGCDVVIDDAAKTPFKKGEFDTVSYLACLNHIPNRNDSVKEAARILKKDGRIVITMITPKMGAFIHWWRFRNDPDHQERHIDHAHELMGMSPQHIKDILAEAGFTKVRRKRFVYGMNNIYIAERSD